MRAERNGRGSRRGQLWEDVETHGTTRRSDDNIATYSSKGPTAIDGLIKPDIVAPGNKVVSISQKDSTLYSNYPIDIVLPAGAKSVGMSYFKLSGTSIAT